jgi:DNA-binding transcriptional ArsR family regulator
MIRTIIHKQYWSIFQLFYANHNSPLHLREISRRINLKESATSRHLQVLEKTNILKSQKEANLKKYSLKRKVIPEIFPLFDQDKIEHLPIIRKNAILEYLRALNHKPLLLFVFGSTAKGTFTGESDVDLLQVSGQKIELTEARRHAEALTGVKLQIFQLSETEFYKELKLKQDPVIQAALTTGFPAFNYKYFYELMNDE